LKINKTNVHRVIKNTIGTPDSWCHGLPIHFQAIKENKLNPLFILARKLRPSFISSNYRLIRQRISKDFVALGVLRGPMRITTKIPTAFGVELTPRVIGKNLNRN